MSDNIMTNPVHYMRDVSNVSILSHIPPFDLGCIPGRILREIAGKLDITCQTALWEKGYEKFAGLLNFDSGEIWDIERRHGSMTMEIFKLCCVKNIYLDEVQRALERMNIQAAEIIPDNLGCIIAYVRQKQGEYHISRNRSPTQNTELPTTIPLPSFPPPPPYVQMPHVPNFVPCNPVPRQYPTYNEPRSNQDFPCTCYKYSHGQRVGRQESPHRTLPMEYMGHSSTPCSVEGSGMPGRAQRFAERYSPRTPRDIYTGVPSLRTEPKDIEPQVLSDRRSADSSRRTHVPNTLQFANGPSSDEDINVCQIAPQNPRKKRSKMQPASVFVTGGNSLEEMVGIREAMWSDLSTTLPGVSIGWDSEQTVDGKTWRRKFDNAKIVIISATEKYARDVKHEIKRNSEFRCRAVEINNAIQQELKDRHNNNERFFTVIFSDGSFEPRLVPNEIMIANYTWPKEKDKFLDKIKTSMESP